MAAAAGGRAGGCRVLDSRRLRGAWVLDQIWGRPQRAHEHLRHHPGLPLTPPGMTPLSACDAGHALAAPPTRSPDGSEATAPTRRP